MESENAAAEGPINDFEALIRAEDRLRRARRSVLGLQADKAAVGLALSGGGIRSATFSLGLLQALSARGALHRFDYLSSVSGGSYVGSFFGALFVHGEERSGTKSGGWHPAFDAAAPLQSPLGVEAVRRLRDSGRYLTPAGTSDAFFGAAVVARNWTAVQLVIGMGALLGFSLLRWVDWFHGLPKSDHVSWSLTWALVVACAFTAAAALAYWLTRRDWIPGPRTARLGTNLFFLALLAVLGWLTHDLWSQETRSLFWTSPWTVFVSVVILLAIGLHVWAEYRYGYVDFTDPPAGADARQTREHRRRDLRNPQLLIPAEDRVRSAHSRSLSKALTATLAVIAVIVVDWLGGLLYDTIAGNAHGLNIGGCGDAVRKAWPTLLAAAPAFSWFANYRLQKAAWTNNDRAAPRSTLLLIAGLLLVGTWLTIWSGLSHWLDTGHRGRAGTTLAVVLAVNIVAGVSFSFINLSSLSTFYASRLRRAYIGASSYGRPFTSVSEDDPEDAIRLENYYREGLKKGAPLHLINVTIAETIPAGSNLVARDRKGKPMHLSPAGLVFEGERPGDVVTQGRRWGEELPLANWIAISGAAVSAAIGSGSSLGLSIMATMANVRLGYWWKQSRKGSSGPSRQAVANPIQRYLLRELRGAFRGTRSPRWYLTDGGHFDNTGIYPLLQRELAFIVASDNGADAAYRLEDLIRLVGRARTDLGAEIHFLNRAALDVELGPATPLASVIGQLDELVRGDAARPGGPIAALARLTYRSGAEGLLLLVKPRLTFREPPEVLAYSARSDCSDFPQQSTGDQFFDEVQWEAYRRLGELAGLALFQPPQGAKSRWTPWDELAQTSNAGQHSPSAAPAG